MGATPTSRRGLGLWPGWWQEHGGTGPAGGDLGSSSAGPPLLLLSLARNCMRLQVLELDHVSEITQEVAAEVCREGLKGLEMLVLTATPVTPKALLHFNSERWERGGRGPAVLSHHAWSAGSISMSLLLLVSKRQHGGGGQTNEPANLGRATRVSQGQCGVRGLLASGPNGSVPQTFIALCSAPTGDMSCSLPPVPRGALAKGRGRTDRLGIQVLELD